MAPSSKVFPSRPCDESGFAWYSPRSRRIAARRGDRTAGLPVSERGALRTSWPLAGCPLRAAYRQLTRRPAPLASENWCWSVTSIVLDAPERFAPVAKDYDVAKVPAMRLGAVIVSILLFVPMRVHGDVLIRAMIGPSQPQVAEPSSGVSAIPTLDHSVSLRIAASREATRIDFAASLLSGRDPETWIIRADGTVTVLYPVIRAFRRFDSIMDVLGVPRDSDAPPLVYQVAHRAKDVAIAGLQTERLEGMVTATLSDDADLSDLITAPAAISIPVILWTGPIDKFRMEASQMNWSLPWLAVLGVNARDEGLILRFQVGSGGHSIEWRVTAVQEIKSSPSRFRVPSGYKEISK